jgi:hypothetical protein
MQVTLSIWNVRPGNRIWGYNGCKLGPTTPRVRLSQRAAIFPCRELKFNSVLKELSFVYFLISSPRHFVTVGQLLWCSEPYVVIQRDVSA